MVADKVVLFLTAFCLHVAVCLPVLRESPEISSSRQERSAVQPYLGRFSPNGVPLLNQWDLTAPLQQLLAAAAAGNEDYYPSAGSGAYVRSRPDAARRPPRHYVYDSAVRPSPLENRHPHHRRTLDYQVVAKRDEEANIPTMGLGVLSDMRKFFNDLRVNLDSVEEAAALSQEQGNVRSGPIDPADFLAFLAKHGARSSEIASGESDLPRNPTHMRRLMFGYNHDDQPYAHSGLGK